MRQFAWRPGEYKILVTLDWEFVCAGCFSTSVTVAERMRSRAKEESPGTESASSCFTEELKFARNRWRSASLAMAKDLQNCRKW